MKLVIIIAAGLIEAIGFVVALFFTIAKSRLAIKKAMSTLIEERDNRKTLKQQLEDLFSQLVPKQLLREKAREFVSFQDTLKAERGRTTITQAELETVENRLRELEEIERELEASGVETKEEINILKKKEKELASKNEGLKNQIAKSIEEMDQLMTEVEVSSQMLEQIDFAKAELINCEQKVDELLLKIEEGNEQYFVWKQRYDALDIEYAQLYEKFSEAESMLSGGSSDED